MPNITSWKFSSRAQGDGGVHTHTHTRTNATRTRTSARRRLIVCALLKSLATRVNRVTALQPAALPSLLNYNLDTSGCKVHGCRVYAWRISMQIRRIEFHSFDSCNNRIDSSWRGADRHRRRSTNPPRPLRLPSPDKRIVSPDRAITRSNGCAIISEINTWLLMKTGFEWRWTRERRTPYSDRAFQSKSMFKCKLKKNWISRVR